MKTTLNAGGTETQTALRVTKRPANARGQTELGWLHSRHSFTFGDYFDPEQMGFRSLRVINDDVLEPGGGFGMHPHKDAEIFSYVVEGELEHRDSMGNGSIIKAGDLQYMSAGRGVTHSEFNPLPDRRMRLLQIWLRPNVSGGEPRYAERALGESAAANALTLLFSGNPRNGAVAIRQDADIYFGPLQTGQKSTLDLEKDRGVWIQMMGGTVRVAGETIADGDGLAITGAERLEIVSDDDAKFLVFVLS